MIAGTGVPLDPRILAEGYYDSDGNWYDDGSYDSSYYEYGYDPYTSQDSSRDSDADGINDSDEVYGFTHNFTVEYWVFVVSGGKHAWNCSCEHSLA